MLGAKENPEPIADFTPDDRGGWWECQSTYFCDDCYQDIAGAEALADQLSDALMNIGADYRMKAYLKIVREWLVWYRRGPRIYPLPVRGHVPAGTECDMCGKKEVE